MEAESDRWCAVRASSGRPRLLRAAVEDSARREIVYVATPEMAVFLAHVLNGSDRGDALPPQGEQHHPLRFQLTHDPMGVSPLTAVVYQNRLQGRIVAEAPSDELARQIAGILNHVDYPMHHGAVLPRVGAFADAAGELGESVVSPPKRRG